MKINSYRFGEVVINGKSYTSDLIIFPQRVKSNWWRKEGHRIFVEDIEEAIREKPDVLIVGTGESGLVKIAPEVREHLEKEGITLIAQATKEACETYNQLCQSCKAIAALHLTC